jgi:hypothetical protein
MLPPESRPAEGADQNDLNADSGNEPEGTVPRPGPEALEDLWRKDKHSEPSESPKATP